MQCLKEDECKIILPINDPKTGEFLGIENKLGFLTVRGDPQERFFNYGFEKKIEVHCILINLGGFLMTLVDHFQTNIRIWY